MRPRALTAAIVVLTLGLIAPATFAHLKNVGGSLLDLLASADGVVVALVVEPTQDPPESHTRMHVIQALAGSAPPAEFSLANALSPLRYAKGQRAIVLFSGKGEDLQAVQLAGEGLVVEGESIDPATGDYVAALWKATHEADPDGDLGALLRTGLRLPDRKIRLLAALDIAEIAHHKPGLSESTRAALTKDLADPALDPAARVALSRALGLDP